MVVVLWKKKIMISHANKEFQERTIAHLRQGKIADPNPQDPYDPNYIL